MEMEIATFTCSSFFLFGMSVLGDVYSRRETTMKGSSPNITPASTPTTPTTTGHRVTGVICLLHQHLFGISWSFQVMPAQLFIESREKNKHLKQVNKHYYYY